MKGWIYVIKCSVMPDILKIGFSRKDPELRALELRSTGSPGKYSVEYEILVVEPQKIEQDVHLKLADKRVDLEWFRVTLEEAVNAIKEASQGSTIYESHEYETKISGYQNPTEDEARNKRQGNRFEGSCPHCEQIFAVTLTASEDSVLCPECNRMFSLHPEEPFKMISKRKNKGPRRRK